MRGYPSVDVAVMIFYTLVVAVPSVPILFLCDPRRVSEPRRQEALVAAPFLILVFTAFPLGMLLPCVNPPAYEGAGAGMAWLVFDGYAFLQLARHGVGFRKYLGIVIFLAHVAFALKIVWDFGVIVFSA